MTTKRTPRAPRTPKPSSGPLAVLTAIIKLARTVNPANIIDVVRRANAGYTTATRNVGRYTGMRVMAFQNASFIANADPAWQLDDCQLLAVWCMEFPATVGRVFAVNGRMGTPDVHAIIDGISIVRGVRSDYNRTGHGLTPERKPVAIPSVSYGSKRFDIHVPESTVTTPAEKPAKPRAAKSAKPALRKTA